MTKFLDSAGATKLARKVKDWANGRFADKSHSHSAADITGGTLPVSRGGTGQTSLSSVSVGSATKATAATTAQQLAYCNVEGDNTNNYPFHRIAKIENVTGQWSDTDSVFLVRQRYDSRYFGVFKVSMRTNASNSDVSVGARWLVRSGFAADSLQWGRWGVTGNKCYADVFLKVPDAYPRTEVVRISTTQGAWTMVSSMEAGSTTASDRKTSSECYSSLSDAAAKLHGGTAYTATGSAGDIGSVSHAGTADSATSAASASSAASATSATYASQLANTGGRIADANQANGDGRVRYYLATSSMTKNKPSADGHILHLAWDNKGGWDSQISQNDTDGRLEVRAQNGGTWSAWRKIPFSSELPTVNDATVTVTAFDGTTTTFTANQSSAKTVGKAMSDAQKNAVNSGITESGVSKLNGIASGATKDGAIPTTRVDEICKAAGITS